MKLKGTRAVAGMVNQCFVSRNPGLKSQCGQNIYQLTRMTKQMAYKTGHYMDVCVRPHAFSDLLLPQRIQSCGQRGYVKGYKKINPVQRSTLITWLTPTLMA